MDDPDLAIAWPIRPTTLSERDRALPRLAEIRDRLAGWFGSEPPDGDATGGALIRA